MRQPNPVVVEQAQQYKAAQLSRAGAFAELAAWILERAAGQHEPTAGHFRAAAEVLMSSAGFLAQHGLRFAEDAQGQWGPSEETQDAADGDE